MKTTENYSNCIDRQGRRTNHQAEGWLCSPDGLRIVPKCEPCALKTIREYQWALGEVWTFAKDADEFLQWLVKYTQERRRDPFFSGFDPHDKEIMREAWMAGRNPGIAI